MTSAIHILTGPTLKFPLSQAFIVESSNKLLLADAGCGRDTLFGWLNQNSFDLPKIDMLLISHPHPDHMGIASELIERHPDLHVMALHEAIPLIEDWKLFKEHYADFSPSVWEKWEKYVRELTGFQNFNPVNEALRDGQKIAVGELTLEVLETPGHTPGHLALLCPELSTLLPFDIDLTPFPWYGNKNSDLSAFVESIKRLQELEVKRVITSHHKPIIEKAIPDSFERYLNKIEQREQKIKALTMEGLSFKEILDQAPIYGKHNSPIFRGFEKEMVRQHLERLGLFDEVFTA